MPELPEVEVTRRRIAPFLEGRKVQRLVTTKDSYFFVTPTAELRRRLEGRRVVRLERRGKYLLAALDDEATFVIHLGMTGQLFAAGASSVRLLSATARASLAPEEQGHFEPDEHTHLHFQFGDAQPDVFMRDVRKFGKVFWMAPGSTHPRLERLGEDALQVAGEALFAASRGRKIAVKAFLLDQAVIAGVGNIYADEALFFSGVRPGRRAARLTKAECEKLATGIRQILERSIETGGSSISDYVAPDGSDGAYQDERKVYARTGEPCHQCGEKIRRKVIAARSSHYCSKCQK